MPFGVFILIIERVNGRGKRALVAVTVTWALIFVAACGAAFAGPSPEQSSRRDRQEPEVEPSQDRPRRSPLPQGRAIGRMPAGACRSTLAEFEVPFEELNEDQAPGVEIPIRLTGPIGGITVGSRGPSENNEIMDCRLVVALLAWSDELRAASIVHIDHFSTYRPEARVARSGEPSGHARAMAIDVGRFHRADGVILDVVDVWAQAERGADPCEHITDESDDLRTLRSLVCASIDDDLFQIVLTPHFDRVHRNHVHLELRPDVEWSYVR